MTKVNRFSVKKIKEIGKTHEISPKFFDKTILDGQSRRKYNDYCIIW